MSPTQVQPAFLTHLTYLQPVSRNTQKDWHVPLFCTIFLVFRCTDKLNTSSLHTKLTSHGIFNLPSLLVSSVKLASSRILNGLCADPFRYIVRKGLSTRNAGKSSYAVLKKISSSFTDIAKKFAS